MANLRRAAGNESGREEKDFSPAEMLKNTNNLSLHEVEPQEAVPSIMTSEAEGYKYRPQTNCKALRPLPESLQPILSAYSVFATPSTASAIQPLFPPISADDGNDKQLSSLKQEAFKTRGQPWDVPGPRCSLWECFPIWRMWNRISEQRKGLIRRKLEF